MARGSVNLAYRGAVAIWIFVTLIQPLVFIVVWRTVAGSGETGGYTANQFVAYFLVMMVVDHLTFIWHMWEFEWRIRTGAFSPLLMRPIHPIHNDVCENLAYKTVGLVGVLPAAVLLGLAFDADLSGVTVRTVLPFLVALVLAMVLRFVVEWCLALAAFWLTKVTAINSLFFASDHLLRRGVRAAGGAAGVDADRRGVDAVPVEPGLPGRGVPGPAYGDGHLDRVRRPAGLDRPGARWSGAAVAASHPAVLGGGGMTHGLNRRGGRPPRTPPQLHGLRVLRAFMSLGVLNLVQYRSDFFIALLNCGDRPGHPGAGPLGDLHRHRRPAAAGTRTTCWCWSASTSSSPG